jgi:hypothetical protein
MSADTGVLAQLMAQAAREGADLNTMRAVAEEAGELSATRALTRLGLADEGARADLMELRELLATWRDAKRSVWKAAAGWCVRLAGALLLTGLAVKLGFGEWLK